jgi:hypothetical protein
VRTTLPLANSQKHAAQHPEKLRKKPSLNYKSAALDQLSYAGVSRYQSCFQRVDQDFVMTISRPALGSRSSGDMPSLVQTA